MNTPNKLSTVLDALGPLIMDDVKASEHDRIVREARDMEASQQRADRLEREHVPLVDSMRAALISSNGLDELPNLQQVQRWLHRPDAKPWLVLVGMTGCGKSVSAAWAIANGPHSHAWRSRRAVIQTFAGYFGPAAADQELMYRCKLLVLDDIGTETEAERMGQALGELLEQRKGLKTLVTTNLTRKEWELRYPDPRLHSRLRESAVFFTDKSADMRGKKSA